MTKLPHATKYCLCATCGEYFTNVTNFDLHRRDGECVYPGDIVNKKGKAKLRKNANGMWARTGGVYRGNR